MRRTTIANGLALTALFATALGAAGGGCGGGGAGDAAGTAGSGGAGATGATGGSGGVGATTGGGGGVGTGGFGGFQIPDGGQDGPAGCASSSEKATLMPANILFVIDRSGSMNCNPPPLQQSAQCETSPAPVDPGQPSKWDIVSSALKSTIQGFTPPTAVGLTYFNNDDFCGVQKPAHVPLSVVSPDQVNLLQASIDAVAPKGATPVIGGTILGYAYLHEPPPEGVGGVYGNKFVVLVSDGAETCISPGELEDWKNLLLQKFAPDALAVNIRTFVIGVPGSEPARNFLSQLAFQGGTAQDPACVHDPSLADDVGDCHFDMTTTGDAFATELKKVLDGISGKALSCEFDVPETVTNGTINYDKVNVTFKKGDGTLVELLRDSTPPCNSGWDYNDDKSKILICGTDCDLVKGDVQGEISIVLGCETKFQ